MRFTLKKSFLKIAPLFSVLISGCLLIGCGYHIGGKEETISVRYFKGDANGDLTDAVIKACAISEKFHYTGKQGSLLLEGTMISDANENIGYQFDRAPVSGQRIHRLVPNEGRREITIEIVLTDTRTQKIIYGPARVSAFADYDFVDSDSLRDTSFVNIVGDRESSLFFSMGQLDSIDGAQRAALDPIYRRLALKIVERISNLAYTAE